MISWFISDTHIGHNNIIKYCDRPFSSIEEHDTAIIRSFDRVSQKDVVLWLGDCFLTTTDRAREIMSSLPGVHLLVLGNHDRSAAAMTSLGFSAVMNTLTLRIAGLVVRANHKPSKIGRGEFQIHGHVHAKWRKQNNQIHVGVDAWDYRPVHFDEIEELLKHV